MLGVVEVRRKEWELDMIKTQYKHICNLQIIKHKE